MFDSVLPFDSPTHGDGDIIVAAGNSHRKEVDDMYNDNFTKIGYAVVWLVKYIFIPLGVAVSARIIADRLLQPPPDRQKKKRSN